MIFFLVGWIYLEGKLIYVKNKKKWGFVENIEDIPTTMDDTHFIVEEHWFDVNETHKNEGFRARSTLS